MWPNPQETADLVIFTEEILNGKLHFLCSENIKDFIYFGKLNMSLINIIYVFTYRFEDR